MCCEPQVKGFAVVNKAEVDVLLELSCFFDNPTDVDILISGSSAFSKTSLGQGWWDEAQARIKMAGRNINNLR